MSGIVGPVDGVVPAEVERLGHYLLLERLAPYGMVQPYLARREGAIDLVVVKRLLPQLATHTTAPRRFAREARLTRLLQNPHLVRTIDVGYFNNELFMVTEFVAGVRLDLLLADATERGQPLPLDIVSGIADAVLDAMAYAHGAVSPDGRPLGLVHRDLTPRSVFLGFNGDVKLGDFGVARSQWDSSLTAPGMTVGTLAYMSPEQVTQTDLDLRTDIYSFSVVLYELLAGARMIQVNDPISLLKAIKSETPVPLRELRSDLPAQLSDVVARGLVKTPDERWQDAAQYRAALHEAFQSVAPTGSSERLGAFVRARMPEHETRFFELLDRVREVSSVLPAPEDGSGGFSLYEQAPVYEDLTEPPVEPTPEPSVMTMPGTVVPVVTRRPRRRAPSSKDLWRLGAVVVSVAALVTAGLWWAFIVPRPSDSVVVIPPPVPPVDSTADLKPQIVAPPSLEASRPVPESAPRSLQAPKPPAPPRARRRTQVIEAPVAAAPAAAGPVVPATVAVPSPNASPPVSPLAAQLADFARRLSALERAEDDIRAFDALLLDMKKTARTVDPAVERAVLRDLSAAERAFDVEGLAQALRRLKRYEGATGR